MLYQAASTGNWRSCAAFLCIKRDVAEALRGYLDARGSIEADELCEVLIVADANFAGGHRLSRRGRASRRRRPSPRAQRQTPQVSNHALRHTSGTLAYRYTFDLRAVQNMLGHQDPKTTARYARVVDRARTNSALKVPVASEGTETMSSRLA